MFTSLSYSSYERCSSDFLNEVQLFAKRDENPVRARVLVSAPDCAQARRRLPTTAPHRWLLRRADGANAALKDSGRCGSAHHGTIPDLGRQMTGKTLIL